MLSQLNIEILAISDLGFQGILFHICSEKLDHWIDLLLKEPAWVFAFIKVLCWSHINLVPR